MSDSVKLTELVRDAVDKGATTPEEIHQAVANLPLHVLEGLDLFERSVEDVRKIQDLSIGAVCALIREVNRKVTHLAWELLEPPSRA